MQECPDKLINVWPHSTEVQQVTSFRLFAAWKPEWNASLRVEAWQNLAKTSGKILIGTEVKFIDTAAGILDTEGNRQMFDWALELMQILGPDRIMGFQIGNEVDHSAENAPEEFWNTGYWQILESYVADLDANGFGDVPITAAWTMGAAFQGWWPELLGKAQEKWGDRWVWSFNPYPIWDSSFTDEMMLEDPDCASIVARAIDIAYTKNSMASMRNKVRELVGNDNYKLWVTESGWSSPGVSADTGQDAQIAAVKACPQWGSPDSLYTFYQNIMEWDLSLDDGSHGVDHLFYFTMRDAVNVIGGNIHEGFGLISTCEDTACKVDDTLTLVSV